MILRTRKPLYRMLGCWIPSRRFGIRQSKKLRVIDDFAASLVNDALSAEETVDPDGLDRIAANAKAHLCEGPMRPLTTF